jgi:FCD domain
MTCISKFGAAGRPRAPRHFAGPRLSAALRADPQRRDRAGATYHDPGACRGVWRQRNARARGPAAAAAARALTVISGRSIGIPPLTGERLSDLRRVRLEVESLAAIWATYNISDSDIGWLEECVTAMAEAVRSGDDKQYLRWNRAFHF